MTERDAFIWKICEQPDENLRRLVFADWLDDNNESAYASYIRSRVADPTRAESFVGQHDSTGWFPGTHVPDAEFTLDRGFVSQLRISCGRFIADGFAAKLFAQQPVTKVVFTDRAPLHFERRFLWHNADHRLRKGEGLSTPDCLPSWLHAVLEGFIPRPNAKVLDLVKGYTSSVAAKGFLERAMPAAVAWGRQQAGLPAWEPARMEVG